MRVPNTAALVTEIREQADEKNVNSFTDEGIVRVMNRGLRFVTSQLARNWEEPLVTVVRLSPSSYDRDRGFDLPSDIFENRVTYVEAVVSTSPVPIPFRSYSSVSSLKNGATASVPLAMYMRGNGLYTAPHINGGYDLDIYYVRIPDPLTLPIGRVNVVGPDSTYVVLDNIQLDRVSAASDQRLSYVNVIDGMTGQIKGTHQVSRVDLSKVTFRTSNLTRSEVEGRTVSADPAATGIAADDWLCPVDGTCVPQIGQFAVTYITLYAAAEIGRSLGDAAAQISQGIALRAEQAASQQRTGRPSVVRVKNRSPAWGVPRIRQLYPTQRS